MLFLTKYLNILHGANIRVFYNLFFILKKKIIESAFRNQIKGLLIFSLLPHSCVMYS